MHNERENCDREVLQLHFGSAGLQIGHQCWQLYAREHHVDADGCVLDETSPPRCFFSHSDGPGQQRYHPRALFFDDDLAGIDQLRTSHWRDFYADGRFFHAKTPFLDGIRKHVEGCDRFQGCIFTHSTSGKSSRVTSEVLVEMVNEYPKGTMVSDAIVGPSVNVCHLATILKHADVVLPMENQAIIDICKRRLDIPTPTYAHINRLIAHRTSVMTSSMRFDGCLFSSLEEFPTTLVPLPRLKIVSSYLFPLLPRNSEKEMGIQTLPVYEMCTPLFNQSDACFIHQANPYKMVVSASLLFRGETIVPKDVGQKLICELKRCMRFSESSPCGFRCGINYQRPTLFNDQWDILAPTDKQVLMLANQTTTAKYLCRSALDQHHSPPEQTEVVEAMHHLQEVEQNYDEVEKDILEARDLDA